MKKELKKYLPFAMFIALWCAWSSPSIAAPKPAEDDDGPPVAEDALPGPAKSKEKTASPAVAEETEWPARWAECQRKEEFRFDRSAGWPPQREPSRFPGTHRFGTLARGRKGAPGADD